MTIHKIDPEKYRLATCNGQLSGPFATRARTLARMAGRSILAAFKHVETDCPVDPDLFQAFIVRAPIFLAAFLYCLVPFLLLVLSEALKILILPLPILLLFGIYSVTVLR